MWWVYFAPDRVDSLREKSQFVYTSGENVFDRDLVLDQARRHEGTWQMCQVNGEMIDGEIIIFRGQVYAMVMVNPEAIIWETLESV